MKCGLNKIFGGHAALNIQRSNILRQDQFMAEGRTTVSTMVSVEERSQLEAEAAAEGVTLSTLLYRRALNKPDAERRPGRPAKHARTQPEGIFSMTG